MPALVAQTQASKQHAEELRVQLGASAEELQLKVQDIVSLRVSLSCPMAAQALSLFACCEHNVQKAYACGACIKHAFLKHDATLAP